MGRGTDILEFANGLKAHGEAFALATVVRTVSATAAKAGAKAVIRADGSISAGWIGGGCARAAVLSAARQALIDGQSRLVSVQPVDVLKDQGLRPGDSRDGIQFARNMCPSQGTMDVFVEPVLPRPGVLVCGASPVAVAVAELAARFGFAVTVAAPAEDIGRFPDADGRLEGYDQAGVAPTMPFAVVATQGRGDEAALQAAVSGVAGYVAFVGSHRKAAALREALTARGVDPERLARVRAPAGLDIGAITPEEIALSIVAEMVEVRRRGKATRSFGLERHGGALLHESTAGGSNPSPICR
jgi:xanthine dehydrogenase accessory factor